MYKSTWKVFIFLGLLASLVFAAESRIKEIAYLEDARPNQVMGYGLVVGLKNSGDSSQILFTYKSLFNLLKKMGIAPDEKDIKSRNIASVMVTTEIPPFSKPGQKLDIHISSVGDATSLRGGALLYTLLQGADGKTYASAQGNLVVGGLSAEAGETRYQKNESNRAMIPDGGIVEQEIPVKLNQDNYLTFILKKPDFITAARMSLAIEDSGLAFADSYDAAKVQVRLAAADRSDLVSFIAKLQEIRVLPDSTARIVISERTGAIVIGERVKIDPVAINFGDISIRVDKDIYDVVNISVSESKSQFQTLEKGNTLQNLVKSLNALGTKPSTMISILQAIKSAGAITAEIEVI